MKIDRIECVNLRFEYPRGQGFHYGGGQCSARVTSLVLVHTDTGQVGIGSAYAHPGLVHLVVEHQLAPLLRGDDPTKVEDLWAKMYGLTRWYGRKGAAMAALGALDVAFWDLRGKAAGQPLWRMLGGSRGTSPAYASALLWKDQVSELAEEAGRHLARGFRRMKLRMGKSEEYDCAAVRAVRAAIGPNLDLMVDAGMRYNVALARRVGAVLADAKVFWYEEPFEPEDIDSYAALRGTVPVRVAAGENEFGIQGFRELIRAGAVDIVQPDASRCGGLSEVWKVVQLAKQAGLRFAPHTWSDAIAVTANAHAVAAGDGLTVEVDQTGNPFIEQLLAKPLAIRDGILDLGDAPGLGIELDLKVVEKLRMPDQLRVPDGVYSDMVFGAQNLKPAGPYRELT